MLKVLIALIPWVFYLFFRTKKSLHMLQQNLYDDDRRYCKWLLKNINKVMFKTETLQIFLIFFILYVGDRLIVPIIFGIIYTLLSIDVFAKDKKEIVKKPLVVTKRVKRILFTLGAIYGLSIWLFIRRWDINIYVVFTIMAYLQYLLVLLVQKINIPAEKYVYFSFKRKAMKKLNSMKHLKIVGITGSYGKTTSKNILSDILNIKYNALPTPKSLNTPYGLIITINNHLDKFDEVFIAEMGAYKRGEVQQLCDLVHPKYGILTKIGTAHLDTFGSQDNIQLGKFELIENLPSDGVGILNGDDELQLNYKLKNNCKIVWIGIDNKDVDVRAENIKTSNLGTTFDVTFKGIKNKFKFETKLLGYANVYNILAGIALGYEFGIKPEQLVNAVKRVNAVEHRLELKQSGDITYIDDAYNSNPVGSKMALEVLSTMPGKKIIVTPGMTELGDLQYELNKKFGEYISEVCDEVVLVGVEQTKPIQDGLKEKKYSEKNIHILENVSDAFKLINKLKGKETYVLLENDLPDIFN